VPKSFTGVKTLKVRISSFTDNNFPILENLRNLQLQDCDGLKPFEISNFPNLRLLELDNCCVLEKLLVNGTSLETLKLIGEFPMLRLISIQTSSLKRIRSQDFESKAVFNYEFHY
jgi:hypothetical protein